MPTYVQLTRMAPALFVPALRQLCAVLSESGTAAGEMTTGLVPKGSAAGALPTWFITSGPIEASVAAAMQSPQAMLTACLTKGWQTTILTLAQTLGASRIDPRGPWEVMNEMGLELAQPADLSSLPIVGKLL